MSQLNQTPTEKFGDATPIPRVENECPCVEEVRKRYTKKGLTPAKNEDYSEYENLPPFEPTSKDGRNPHFRKYLGKNCGVSRNHNIPNSSNDQSLVNER